MVTNLTTIIPNLALKMDESWVCETPVETCDLSLFVDEMGNML